MTTLDNIESQTAELQALNTRLNQVADDIEGLRIELDRALRNISYRAESVPTGKKSILDLEIGEKILVRADQFAEAMDQVDQFKYCCDAPNLQWSDDPDNPSVSCTNCHFPVVEAGSVVMAPPPEAPSPKQATLFDS